MKNKQIKSFINDEIRKVAKLISENDAFKPEFGTGDVVHDCPKHVQEMISGKKGKVVAHSLNESGQVNYVDVDFGTGKVYRDIPTKKLKILEGQTHEHATKDEPEMNEVDYSTMRLKSNIDQKWDSTDVMMDDLRQWIGSSIAASGPEMGLDLADALKLMMNFAKGEAQTARR